MKENKRIIYLIFLIRNLMFDKNYIYYFMHIPQDYINNLLSLENHNN